MSARGIVTNGIGQHYSGHMNLTRTLADVWGLSAAQIAASRVAPVRPPTPTLAEPPPSAPTSRGYYRLKAETGEYLHQSGQVMTNERRFAWMGNGRQLEKVKKVLPIAAGLKSEAVAP